MDCNKLIETSLQNLRENLTNLSLDEFIVNVLESLMEIERNEYLKLTEDPNEKGNGYYTRAFRSLRRNSMMINIPRTRNSNFTPLTLELVKKNREDVDDFCLMLTRKGMTSRDIASVLKGFFNESRSHTTINKMAKQFHKSRLAWEKMKLEKHYIVIFCDATYITVRRDDSYSKEAVYIAYGVRTDGKREILALEINPTESSEIWEEVLQEVKNRGVETTDIVVADGLKGLEYKIHGLFPEAKFQKCVVHKERQILRKTRPKDKAEMAIDLKEVFDNFGENATKENALKKLKTYCNKWKPKYNNIENYFNEGIVEYYFSYIDFPPKIRRMIYTTNSIENLNKVIKKATKNKLSFESPDTLLDYVFIITKDFEDSNWMKYPVYEFKKYNDTQTH